MLVGMGVGVGVPVGGAVRVGVRVGGEVGVGVGVGVKAALEAVMTRRQEERGKPPSPEGQASARRPLAICWVGSPTATA